MARPVTPDHPLAPREDGYSPIASYAAIGDGRTVALVALDGSVDWLCLPDLDSPAVFAALLDSESGGSFTLRPEAPFGSVRRYLPGTNVLETTFETTTGTVRVTDALTIPAEGLSPQRELVRVIETVAGRVPMRWEVTPRFGFGSGRVLLGRRGGVPVASCGSDALAVCSWGAGEAAPSAGGIRGRFEANPADRVVIALSAAHQEPLIMPAKPDVEARLTHTIGMWRGWAEALRVGSAWREAVKRSALALKLLVYAPSGAIAAAATTSLPETVSGERNWDYRFCWVRDSALVLNALLRLGCDEEADAFFWWLMQASQLTHPRVQVLYRLDGGPQAEERTLALDGYLASRPARVGNAAAGQLQLDVYGDLLQAAWLYASSGRRIDPDVGRRLAETTDLVCRIWAERDAGLWEMRSSPQHCTESKMMCAVAIDRALRLAEAGQIPCRHAAQWQSAGVAIREFIERRCWSEAKGSYVRYPGTGELDASLLLGVVFAYREPGDPRLRRTVEAIQRELAHGPYLYRYSGEDGLSGEEGAFLTCSFWLVEALALQGRREEAIALMAELVGASNDVGLFSEEVDPATGQFLGNLPQGLTHLALINAALTLEEVEQR
jgi:GH15 family glucan-1,4-alpha-glucosidase